MDGRAIVLRFFIVAFLPSLACAPPIRRRVPSFKHVGSPTGAVMDFRKAAFRSYFCRPPSPVSRGSHQSSTAPVLISGQPLSGSPVNYETRRISPEFAGRKVPSATANKRSYTMAKTAPRGTVQQSCSFANGRHGLGPVDGVHLAGVTSVISDMPCDQACETRTARLDGLVTCGRAGHIENLALPERGLSRAPAPAMAPWGHTFLGQIQIRLASRRGALTVAKHAFRKSATPSSCPSVRAVLAHPVTWQPPSHRTVRL
jgi:hypothetical protein